MENMTVIAMMNNGLGLDDVAFVRFMLLH